MINKPEQCNARNTLRSTVAVAMLALTGCTHYTTVDESSMAPAIKVEIAGHRKKLETTCRETTAAELHLPRPLSRTNPHIRAMEESTRERDRLIAEAGCKKTLTTRWMCNTGQNGMGEPDIYEAIYCPQ